MLIGWTALWLLLAALLISLGSVINPDDLPSGEAGLGAKALAYTFAAILSVALVVAVWDRMIRGLGGRWTAIVCAIAYALFISAVGNPDSRDDLGELVGAGAFTLGGGMLGGWLRARAGQVGHRGAVED